MSGLDKQVIYNGSIWFKRYAIRQKVYACVFPCMSSYENIVLLIIIDCSQNKGKKTGSICKVPKLTSISWRLYFL